MHMVYTSISLVASVGWPIHVALVNQSRTMINAKQQLAHHVCPKRILIDSKWLLANFQYSAYNKN